MRDDEIDLLIGHRLPQFLKTEVTQHELATGQGQLERSRQRRQSSAAATSPWYASTPMRTSLRSARAWARPAKDHEDRKCARTREASRDMASIVEPLAAAYCADSMNYRFIRAHVGRQQRTSGN